MLGETQPGSTLILYIQERALLDSYVQPTRILAKGQWAATARPSRRNMGQCRLATVPPQNTVTQESPRTQLPPF